MANLIRPLILCGGAGTRLWPLSRDSLPKQFAPLLGERSSFQETALRVRSTGSRNRPLVVTNRAHRFLVERQLAEIDVEADMMYLGPMPPRIRGRPFSRTQGGRARRCG